MTTTTNTPTRPLAAVSALKLTGMVLAGDVAAGAEAVMRLQTGVTGDERTVLVAAMNTVLAPDDDAPAPAPAPAAVAPAPASDRVPFDMDVNELCAAIESRVKGAWKEAKRRIAGGTRHEKRFRAARAVAKGEIPAAPVVSEHTGSRHRTASGLLAARVKELSEEGDARRNAIRGNNLLKQDPVSIEDIEALSDEQVMALVKRPVKPGDTVLERLDAAGLL